MFSCHVESKQQRAIVTYTPWKCVPQSMSTSVRLYMYLQCIWSNLIPMLQVEWGLGIRPYLVHALYIVPITCSRWFTSQCDQTFSMLGKAELELHDSQPTIQYQIETILFCKTYFLLLFADIRGSVHLAMWVSIGWSPWLNIRRVGRDLADCGTGDPEGKVTVNSYTTVTIATTMYMPWFPWCNIGCCLATQSLSLNNTKLNEWMCKVCSSELVGIIFNTTLPRQNSIHLSGSCCSVWRMQLNLSRSNSHWPLTSNDAYPQ